MAIPHDIRRIDDTLWEIPKTHGQGMRVPARIYADRKLLEAMDEGVFTQATGVATLPGIVGASYCMPDGHWGYGFPIGGLAAFDLETGVISPGGIGFDVNCGMRLIRTSLTLEEVAPRLEQLLDGLSRRIPAGTGSEGFLALSPDDFRRVSVEGARWCVDRGFGIEEDLLLTEHGGRVADADPRAVSPRAVERGLKQIGTLGSGNHYLEIQVARTENVFDAEAARACGIDAPDQVVVMFHCGSRGFGHQVATDYLQSFTRLAEGKLRLPDRNLACAPFASKEGRAYFAAMSCAINVSFANRQVILHGVREVFSDVFHRSPEDLGLRMVYDVSHNTATIERHEVEGRSVELLVHRKGATRALGPGSGELPERYRSLGQPVIIGGSMETGSFLLAGTSGAEACFATTAHGSGRAMSRTEAKRRFPADGVREGLRRKGISVRAVSRSGLAEEAGGAYKDIEAVVDIVERAGISRRIVRLLPVGCVKG